MALLPWSERLSVGITMMDAQHKKLVALINRLCDAMASGQSDDVKKDILAELVTYTKVHFLAEENLMRECGYPDLAAHRILHSQLTRKVIELNKRVQKGQMVPSVSLSSFLREWLVDHIVQQDQKYGQFLAAPSARPHWLRSLAARYPQLIPDLRPQPVCRRGVRRA